MTSPKHTEAPSRIELGGGYSFVEVSSQKDLFNLVHPNERPRKMTRWWREEAEAFAAAMNTRGQGSDSALRGTLEFVKIKCEKHKAWRSCQVINGNAPEQMQKAFRDGESSQRDHLKAVLDELLGVIDASLSTSPLPDTGWLPMREMPGEFKDGRDIQLCMFKDNGIPGGRHYIVKTCRWNDKFNVWKISGTRDDMQKPTHYRALPPAPATAQAANDNGENVRQTLESS